MPKTFKRLYEQIHSFEHLHAAYRRARRGKRTRPDVAAFEFRWEDHLLQLSAELREECYRPGPYRFANDKPTLWRWRDAIIERAAALRLTIHEERAQPVPVTHGLPFLGWLIFPYRRRLKRRNVVAFARRFRRLRAGYAAGSCSLERMHQSVQGWIAHAAHGNTHALRRSLLSKPLPRRKGQS